MLGFDTNRNSMINESDVYADTLTVNETITLPKTYNASLTSTMLGFTKTQFLASDTSTVNESWQYTGLNISLTPGVWIVNAYSYFLGSTGVAGCYTGISNSNSVIDNSAYNSGFKISGVSFQYCNVYTSRIMTVTQGTGMAAMWYWVSFNPTAPVIQRNQTFLVATRIG